MEVRYSPDSKLKKIDFKEIYNHICSLKEENKKTFFELNHHVSDEILRRMVELESETVNRLLVLVESDGKPIEKPADVVFSCFEMKEGGSELALEFLLSNFCSCYGTEWVRRDDHSVKYCPPDDFHFRIGMTDEEKDLYEEIPIYEFTNASDLDALIEYEEDYDDDGCYRSAGYYYYYSVNLKALTRLKEQIDIPWRVQQILNPEQVTKLAEEVPGILMSELDYIAGSVFMQKVDSYVSDRARQYESMRAQQWASDMYDILGGTGDENVYMSDGLSITPDGRIVDD
jgi:hypothetical protein